MPASVPRLHPVPAAFVAGFSIVVAVNGLMIWLAVASFSGLYSDRPRDRGLRYNHVLADQRTRDALGWQIDVSWRAEVRQLHVVAWGADGAPLAGARVTATLVRPVEKRAPIGVELTEVAGGRFSVPLDMPVLGNWDADVVVEADGRRYEISRRLFVK